MTSQGRIASIAPCAPALDLLDYAIPEDVSLQVGMVVRIPLRNKEILGIVWKLKNESEFKNLRNLIGIVENINISAEFMSFLTKLAGYYFSPLGSVIKMVLNFDKLETEPKIIAHRPQPLPPLTQSQQETYHEICNRNKPSLLKGVTGSGKTEIYFHLINRYLEEDKQILILIPEIGLSSQIIERFKERFGFNPIIWNSSITTAQKRKIYSQILRPEPLVIFGTRSSLLLPYNNLGLIVIDEEQDGSYKQEDGVRYNARDMAVLRSVICKQKILLLSATPSIETMHNVQNGKYHLTQLDTRFGAATMPRVEIIDMKQHKLPAGEWISTPLLTQLQRTLEHKLQSLIFLNRKGYSPLVLCRKCGHRMSCPNCSAYLTMHRGKKKLQCHLCDYVKAIPQSCPECHHPEQMVAVGPGIERIAEEVALKLPHAKILLVSRDEMSSQKKINDVLNKISQQEVDIIIGTQIITKGYHFPKLALVGVVDADSGLMGGDLKSSEQTYQLLHQVGGRAGRESDTGAVLVQTYQPTSKLITALSTFDDESFLEYELNSRQSCGMPPFKRMASIVISGNNEIKLQQVLQQLMQRAPRHEDVRLLGPAPSLIARIDRQHRMRIIVLSDKNFNLPQYLKAWLGDNTVNTIVPSSVKMSIDVDPYNLA